MNKTFKNITKLFPVFLSIIMFSCSENPPPATDKKFSIKSEGFYDFPQGFLWGTATASYQVEGGITNDWSTNGLDAGVAADHYKKFHADFEAAKNMGNNSHRFSIEWARIEPEQGKFNMDEVEHYKKVLKSMKENGLKPMVTLHHFTNPVWVAKLGGWENKEVITHFVNYVRFIVTQLKSDVDLWVTINEPNVYAFKAYDSGVWPPYKKERKAALQVMGNLLKAHGEAYRAIHEVDISDADTDGKACEVGFAQHIAILQPYSLWNPVDNLMVYFQNKVFNESFWQAIITGKIDISIPGVPGVKEPFNKNLKGSMDFVGFNYYTRWMVNSKGMQLTKKNAEVSDLGWEIYPEGMTKAIGMANKYASKLKIPIYITENGIDDGKDAKRAKYVVSHLKKVWDAIQKGIPVKGYMYWSLMDNYEWADKYGPKFGFMTIDRQMRDSGEVYKQICLQNAMSYNLYKKYFPIGE